MSHYVNRFLDHSGHVYLAVSHDAPNDESAIQMAGSASVSDFGKGVEVWSDGRLVHSETWDDSKKR